MRKIALGVDIGNVIINFRGIDIANSDDWKKEYISAPPSNGVFSALKKLSTEKFNGNIFLISKCQEEAEELVRNWLEKHDFYKKTGIKPENVFFCQERSEKEKICTEKGVTHFIDDRLEVLGHMVDKIPYLYLFQPEEIEVNEFREFVSKVIIVQNWTEILNKII